MKTQVVKEDKKLILTRDFDAPPSLLFEVWSDCKHLKHWWGPKEWPMDECDMDFRADGKWHYCLRGPNEGDESWGLAKYKEINKPNSILYIDYFSDEDRNINQDMPGMQILIEFQQKNNGTTRQISTTEFSSNEERDKIYDMGVVDGMESSSLRLDEYLQSIHQKTP